jgi:acyl carrier protein
MKQEDVYEKLADTFRDVFDDDAIVVHPELTANDVDEWDSLTHLRLMLTIEKAFGVHFSASEVGRLKNVGELAALIQSKTSVQAAK